MQSQTLYRNTDLDLKSRSPLTALSSEFDRTCCLLHNQQDEDGNWHVTIESSFAENKAVADDIRAILSVLSTLTPDARKQWDSCYFRDFNLGFDCGNTSAYAHALSPDVVRAVADANCSISITLYSSDCMSPQ